MPVTVPATSGTMDVHSLTVRVGSEPARPPPYEHDEEDQEGSAQDYPPCRQTVSAIIDWLYWRFRVRRWLPYRLLGLLRLLRLRLRLFRLWGLRRFLVRNPEAWVNSLLWRV